MKGLYFYVLGKLQTLINGKEKLGRKMFFFKYLHKFSNESTRLTVLHAYELFVNF